MGFEFCHPAVNFIFFAAVLVKALTAFFEHSLVAERDGVYRFL